MSGGKRKKKKAKRSGYHPAPTLPEQLEDRYALVLAALAGAIDKSEAARRAGMSRNHFQTLVHRAQESMIESLVPKPPGRPPRSTREVELEQQVEHLSRQNQKLQERVDTIDRLLGVASDMLKGRLEQDSRGKWKSRSRKKKPSKTEGTDDDESGTLARLEAAQEMRQLGLAPVLAAAVVGAGASTVRRWAAREREGVRLCRRRGPRRPRPPPEVREKVEGIVRELEGLVGADSLRHSVEGLSRRQAAEIKCEVLTTMERERREASVRIIIHVAGVLRGFDAMHRRAGRKRPFLLAAGDGAVPYRTTLQSRPVYDSPTVAALLEQDIDEHGPPLVLRMDRATQHRTDQVTDLLDSRGVLLLHGPPHHAQYYAQLERQNREQRDWLNRADPTDAALPAACAVMQHALNAVWRRRTLGWQTAEEVWKQRPPITIDRAELRDQVAKRTERLRGREAFADAADDVVARFAIEQELMQRGLMSRQPGGWC